MGGDSKASPISVSTASGITSLVISGDNSGSGAGAGSASLGDSQATDDWPDSASDRLGAAGMGSATGLAGGTDWVSALSEGAAPSKPASDKRPEVKS